MRSKDANPIPTPINRVVLDSDVTEKLDRWVIEINAKVDHVNLRRMDLVNWLIRNRPADLNPREQMRLAETHNDELAFTAWAHKRIREARVAGELLTLEQLLKERTETLSRAFRVVPESEMKSTTKSKFSSENSTEINAKFITNSSKS